MKANELMIGDWVLYGDKSVKVLQLSENSKYDWVKPIPLTYEILKKNGWKASEDGYEYIADEATIQCCLPEMRGCLSGVEIAYFQCEYVHQLQHLLRLCGRDELANNFKVCL